MAIDDNLQEHSRSKKEEQMDNSGADARSQIASDTSLHKGEDILAMQDLDPALNAKIYLVNNVRHDTEPIVGSCSEHPWLINNETNSRLSMKLDGRIIIGSCSY